MINMKDMVDGYLAALLWVMPATDEQENPGDGLSIHIDLAPGVREQAEKDCLELFTKTGVYLEHASDRISSESLGHDFALVRNGHGAGFWDRKELKENGLGETLSKAARTFKENNLYVGDDGKVYFDL